VIHYALGHYGPLMRPVEPHVAEKIFAQPRAKDLEGWERDQTPLAEFRKRLGPKLSDEELLLRYFCPEDQVDKMLAGPPLRTAPHLHGNGSLDQVTRLIEGASEARHISLRQPGISLDLRREN
jgi:oxaloacetate decarboxylase alpha subunit